MDYNTQRKKLVIPEYGRNIQMMIDHVVSIEDREERNKAARTIISIMGNLNPHLRDVSDFTHKLWDHLAIISEFKLDIDSPYEMPDPELLERKPDPMPYNTNSIRFRHYGRNIELMINKACEMEDSSEKELLTVSIANHMKKAYLTWNREAVTDEQIFSDMNILSKEKLKIKEGLVLNETKDILSKNKKKKSQRRNK